MKDRYVYRKPDIFSPKEEYLGELLGIVPFIYQDAGIVTTDDMVYFIRDDGSIGRINRIDALIKDSKS